LTEDNHFVYLSLLVKEFSFCNKQNRCCQQTRWTRFQFSIAPFV